MTLHPGRRPQHPRLRRGGLPVPDRSETGPRGLLLDPISTPGEWHTNWSHRFVHTQDPVGSGGMDDRFDQLLVSGSLMDGRSFDYIGLPMVPYSDITWDDPNHSYRVWGNDGTSFNAGLTVSGNTMVGPMIAQALRDAAASGGHLPIFLDLRVPARIDAPPVVDFGVVQQGAKAEHGITVRNAGDTDLWTAWGIANLNYGLLATPGFASPPGPFVALAGGANAHALSMDTSATGAMRGLLTIRPDAPDSPVLEVELRGEVAALNCYPDFTGDGALDLFDFLAFVNAFGGVEGRADCTADGVLDLFDFLCFANAFHAGC